MPYPMMRKDALKRCSLSADLTAKLNIRCLNFCIQNNEKIRIAESGNELWYVVKDKKLFRDIYSKVYKIKNPEGNDIGGFVFAEKDIEKYLDVIGFS